MCSICPYISLFVELDSRSMLLSPVRIMVLSQVILIDDKTASIFSIHSIFLAVWELVR